jgi:RimJ/RimL family protein N-acetyltransferase
MAVPAIDVATFEITTDRLLLRPPREEDFAGWVAFASDPQTMEFLGGVQPPPLVWRTFVGSVGGWHIQGFGILSVIERETGEWVGRLGTIQPFGWPGTEVGWGIVRSRWGMGYATEGAAAAIDFAVDRLGWDEIIHCIEEGNTASERVAEKLGSRRLRTTRLPPPQEVDVVVWGQSAAEWRDRRG